MLEKVKLDRVICDEIFYVTQKKRDTHFKGPYGTRLGSKPRIIGKVTAAVLDCKLKKVEKQIKADVGFMIQEDLTVIPGGCRFRGGPFDLEYAFRFGKELTFQKCHIPCDVSLDRLKCHIFQLDAKTMIQNIDFAPWGSSGTFDNVVKIRVKIKVLEEVQTFVSLGTMPNISTKVIVSPDLQD